MSQLSTQLSYFKNSFFAKSINVDGDLRKLNSKTGHGFFIKLKTVLTAARKWEPSFEVSLRTIIKK